MNYVGVDLHKKTITVCVMDQDRKVTARKTLSCDQPDQIVEFFRQLRPFQVVVEATASYDWFVELLEPLAEEVVLANPKKLRVIAESTKKTDRLDAQVLAEFLARDMIPGPTCPRPGSGSTGPWSATASTCGGGSPRCGARSATSWPTTTPTARTSSRPAAARPTSRRSRSATPTGS